MRTIILLVIFVFGVGASASAQELHSENQGVWTAQVIEIKSERHETVPGTGADAVVQNIRVEVVKGDIKGRIIDLENDRFPLRPGQKFYLYYLVDMDGSIIYSVGEPVRHGSLLVLLGLFIVTIIGFGGVQGIRSLVSLAASIFIISAVLLPSLLQGYSPILVSIVVASAILFVAIFFTHGFNRESLVAFSGTVIAVTFSTFLAILATRWMSLTGFTSDETVYLNTATQGILNFTGLFLGGVIIGALGVLDDIAVTQTAVVHELYKTNTLSKIELYRRALRVGREHVGALVNTLALAYAGASLPLLLLFSTSTYPVLTILNSEIFAAEIVRTIVGSIGLILTVPITTGLAVWVFTKYGTAHNKHFGHKH